jgi:hypothetical protein
MNILFLSSSVFQGVVAQEKSESDDLRFKWSLIVRIDPDGRNEVENLAKNIVKEKTDQISVSAGDKIAVYLEPDKGTYVYLCLLDSSNKLIPLFPRSLVGNDSENVLKLGKGTYIPGKHKWFSFDEKKGFERFYLLAPPEPLSKLEKLTRNYVETEKEQNLAKLDVLDEIKGIKSAVVLETPQENPISFGGGVRTLEIDISDLAVEVKAKGFYSKAIILKHE